ncbi:MAG TPA: DNA topoisomerase (ATP-hydrolyzing) subunit A [Treponemataceae bacterium]|nr:DNA topoisomerase (ATP-hydrolyzing) subunit A [Treponemataceae bacterium]HPM05845.1 DNA topoisomerase (ATP-hydrolyzing) subunit A [Treponemataceae bacterium]HPY52423.1 DNA topoisomerase (ATP-hydrolyzing) subunit A [Treponemataceae bacterium]HQC26938.1 DNA topoisomerase (ATP-hydrolyzing) subunit A [Treponemataceae bacterium]
MSKEIQTEAGGTLIPISIEDEVKKAYIDYSMSVIVSRALPDVRDGLKPVHRRILYSMEEMGLRYTTPTKKCARIVGDVLGKFHPHGDASVYDALVRMAQDFSLRYTVVEGQGNFGSVDGDPPAAMRYTEAKLAKIADPMINDIKKETVDFVPNYDDSMVEPSVLPAAFPFLLANGSSGIAVGMATNMPPHNLREVATAIGAYIDNPEVSIDELSKIVKGPDFPTGGIIFGRKGIRQAYKTGRGRIIMRGRFTIDIDKKGKETIIFTEIPYQVNKANLITRIGELVRDKGIDGIANINDFSDRNGMKISIELKRGAIAKIVLNQLFTKTALQSTFGVINLALVKGRPETLTLKQLIQYFVEHRQEVVTRRTAFDLRKAEERAHILRGLIKAIQNIDEVIKIIKASRNIETAKNALKERFDFSDIQAQAIVDMRLGRLTSLEIEKLEKELEELEVLIAHLQDLLAHPEKILALIKDETNEIAEKFGDDRKTDIISDEVEEINIEDLIKNEEMVILISNLGYIKRVPVTAYRTQGRGGKGSASTKLVEDDFINQVFIASTHDHIMFITNEGKLYWVKVHEIPEATRNSRGSHIKSLLPMSQNEEITTVVSLTEFSEDQFLFMATAGGIVKKVRTIDFQNAKTRGIIAIRLDEGDKLVSSILSSGEDELVLITRRGQALRVSETEVRPMGRASRGVIGIRLAQGDELAGAIHVEDDAKMLILTEFGCGKQVEFSEFTPHGRGTGGQRIYRISEKTGEIVGTKTIGLGAELVVITSQGKTLRLDSANIPTQGRTAAGVCVFTLDKPDMVIGVDVVAQEE